MSTAIMKKEDVIKQCRAVIADILKRRQDKDKRNLESKIDDLRKSDLFWKKWTLGLCKLRTEEQLREHADADLRAIGWDIYPDNRTSGRWLQAAEDLLTIAELSHLDVMHVDDDEGAVIMRWNV